MTNSELKQKYPRLGAMRMTFYWPHAEIVLPFEVAREFYLKCWRLEFHWFALDHQIVPAVKLRVRSLRWMT